LYKYRYLYLQSRFVRLFGGGFAERHPPPKHRVSALQSSNEHIVSSSISDLTALHITEYFQTTNNTKEDSSREDAYQIRVKISPREGTGIPSSETLGVCFASQRSYPTVSFQTFHTSRIVRGGHCMPANKP